MIKWLVRCDVFVRVCILIREGHVCMQLQISGSLHAFHCCIISWLTLRYLLLISSLCPYTLPTHLWLFFFPISSHFNLLSLPLHPSPHLDTPPEFTATFYSTSLVIPFILCPFQIFIGSSHPNVLISVVCESATFSLPLCLCWPRAI